MPPTWCVVHNRDHELVLAVRMVDGEPYCQSCADAVGDQGVPLEGKSIKTDKIKCCLKGCDYPASNQGSYCTYKHAHLLNRERKVKKGTLRIKPAAPAPAPVTISTPVAETYLVNVSIELTHRKADDMFSTMSLEQKGKAISSVLSSIMGA